jgi:hypothetical protein
LPVTLAIAAEQGRLLAEDNVAMLGIGSGINCIMLGAQWQGTLAPITTRSGHHVAGPHRDTDRPKSPSKIAETIALNSPTRSEG